MHQTEKPAKNAEKGLELEAQTRLAAGCTQPAANSIPLPSLRMVDHPAARTSNYQPAQLYR
jgi:hypothetical protein